MRRGMLARVLVVGVLLMLARRLLVAVMGESASLALSRESRVELFLDTQEVASQSGVTLTTLAPTKYGSNPIFPSGTNNATWDYTKTYLSVRNDAGSWRMWYQAAEFAAPNDVRLHYATSSDGLSWTKPNLGLVSYDGSTDNNIFLDATSSGGGILYDEDADSDKRYLMITGHRPGESDEGIFLYKSASGDADDWTLTKDIATLTSHGHTLLGYCIAKLPDGTYAAYYQDYTGSVRNIAAYTSDTSDVTGSWTDEGILISGSAGAEKYSIGVQQIGDLYLGWVPIYNESTKLVLRMDMYISRDGLTWTLEKSPWLSPGSSGEWDDAGIYHVLNGLVQSGNDWHFYYVGSADLHNVVPADARHGLATLGYRRIGSVGTSGNIVTSAIVPAGPLTINADASGGSLAVELLDASDDSVLDGYSQSDFDTISSDTYGTVATWNGNGIPGNVSVKLKFYLTDATLYSYWIE